ncbi:ABC transporter permease [Bradyrhizobium sp. dw_411]|uniref:ABC transporter permease n=1 Tax=Bradyrhizobium sp. dw_411 TaxID=2720082 RepID=UPI001BCE3B88|nr:ABC transporter permease [Bradyrhizobium sp. dw_411]
MTFAWHLAILSLKIPPYLVPSPVKVFEAFATKWDVIALHTGYTLSSAALGICFSLTLAIGLAIAFTASRNLADAASPIVIAFRSMPVTAIAPIITLALGRGMATSVVVVAIVTFFPLLVNLRRGLTSPDRNAEELLDVYMATRWQRLRYVQFRYSLPYLFAGLRVAGASAILGAMLSEWITGLPGLGNLILDAGELRETALLWAAVLTSIFIALCIFRGASAAERHFISWRR